jgi:hypothetical protein
VSAGVSLLGVSLVGVSLVGVSLVGVSLVGVSLVGVSLAASLGVLTGALVHVAANALKRMTNAYRMASLS